MCPKSKSKVEMIQISITVPKDLLEFIDTGIEHHVFSNRSHAFTYAIAQVKERSIDKGSMDIGTQ